MGRIAVSITHESDYAVAIAFGVRTAGGRYVFPLDIEARLDDRERKLLARMERLRSCTSRASAGAGAPEVDAADGSTAVADRRPARFRAARGRRDAGGRTRRPPCPPAPPGSTTTRWPSSCPSGTSAGHKGTLRQAPRDRRVPRLRRGGAPRVPGGGPRRCRARHARRARVAPAAVRREGRRGDDDGAARGRRRGGRPGAGAGAGSSTTSTTRWSSAPACGRRWRPASCCGCSSRRPRRPAVRRASCSTPRRSGRSRRVDDWWTGVTRAVRPDAARRRVRPAPGRERPRPPTRTATSRPTTPRGRGGDVRGRRVAPGRRAQGREDRHRRPGRLGGGRAVREPGDRDRRHRRRPGGRRSARCSRRASRRTTRRGSASTSTGWPARPSASGSATPACSPATCRRRSRSPASAWPRIAERQQDGTAARVRRRATEGSDAAGRLDAGGGGPGRPRRAGASG